MSYRGSKGIPMKWKIRSRCGVVFGFMPAKRASQLNPIDALAHD